MYVAAWHGSQRELACECLQLSPVGEASPRQLSSGIRDSRARDAGTGQGGGKGGALVKPITLAQYLGDEPRDRYLPRFIGACLAALLILVLA